MGICIIGFLIGWLLKCIHYVFIFSNSIPNSKDCQLINLVGFTRMVDFTWRVVNMDFIVEEIVGCQSKEKV